MALPGGGPKHSWRVAPWFSLAALAAFVVAAAWLASTGSAPPSPGAGAPDERAASGSSAMIQVPGGGDAPRTASVDGPARPGAATVAVAGSAGGSPEVLAAGPMSPGFDLGRIIDRIHFAFREEGGVWSAGHSTHEARLVDGGALELTPFHWTAPPPAADGGAPRAERIAVRGLPVSFGAARITRGDVVLAEGAGTPAGTAEGQLDLVKGPVVEELRNSADGVEQRWAFEARPDGRGDVEVRVAVSGGTYLDDTDGGLHFAAGALGVRYGHGTWIDGLGVRTPVPARWDGEAIVLRVPASAIDGSSYPAVLDPTISGELQIDLPTYTGSGGANPAIAFGGTDYLVVWEDSRNGGADIYGVRVTGDGYGISLIEPRGGIPIARVGGDQTSPAVAWDGTNYLVVWSDGRNGADVYGARVTATGTVLDPNGFPISTAPASEVTPVVAFGSTTYLVAWQSYLGTTSVVRGARLTTLGALVADPVDLTSPTVNSAQNPSVASNGAVFLLSWQDDRSGTSNIYARRVTASGYVYPEVLVSGAAGAQTAPSVARLGTGWYLAWSDQRSGPADVYGSRISSTGGVVDPGGRAICVEAGNQLEPRVATTTGGTALVTWRDLRSGASQIYADVIDPAVAGTVPGHLVGDGNGPAVATGGAGGWLVAYSSSSSWPAAIMAVPVTAAGSVRTMYRLPVSLVAAREYRSAVAYDGTNYLVVWEDERGTQSIYGVLVRESDGALLTTPILISGAFAGAFPAVAWSSAGARYLVAWADPGGQPTVYGQLLTSAGALSGSALTIAGSFQVGSTSGRSLRLAANGAGGFLAAMETRVSSYGGGCIYAARVTAGGVTPDSMAPILVSDGGNQSKPAVASDGTDYLVLWEDMKLGDMNVSGGRVRASDGAVLTPAGLGIVIAPVYGAQGMPDVAFNGSTDYLAVWADGRSGFAIEIYAGRLRADGTTYPSEGMGIPVATGGSGFTAFSPAVAWDGREWIVAWREQATPSSPWVIRGTAVSATEPDPAAGRATVLDPDGFEICSADLDDVQPGLAAAGIGRFLVARGKEGVLPGLDKSRIFARRVSNAAPTAGGQSLTTLEDTPRPIVLTGGDADLDALAYAIRRAPAHGVLTGTPPNLTYVPAANYNGGDSFTFRTGDGMAFSGDTTVSLTVTAVNDAPVANAAAVTTPEDTPAAITLTGSDVEGTALTYVVDAQPAHGVLAGTPPNLTYTPAANYAGPDAFTFHVRDSGTPLPALDSVTATVSLTITPVNDAPVASDQTLATDEDTILPVALGASDVDGDPLAYILVSAPTHGQLGGTPPALTYRPDPNYSGADSFVFKANDGRVDSGFATVRITVNPVNDPPVATPMTVSTPEDTPVGFTLAGTDVDGDSLGFTTVTTPAHGTLSVIGAGTYLYTPAADYNGNDTFQFTASDGRGGVSPAATVTIVVTAVNDAPRATPQALTTSEDVPLDLVLSGTDLEGSALTYVVDALPAHGTLGGVPPNLRYTPAPNYAGSDSFTFRVRDAGVPPLDSAPASVTLTIQPVNDPPVALPQTVNADEDVGKAIVLSGSDVDGDALTYRVVTPPAHGTLSGTPPSLTYQPALDYSGPDTFTFTVNDGALDAPSPALVSIAVAPVNDAPVATARVVTAAEDTPLTFTVSGSDVDGDALTFAAVVQPAHGTVTSTGASFTYTPAADYSGPDAFTFKASDGRLDSALATITVNVTPVNDPPVATPRSATVAEDTPGTFALAGTDVDGDALTYELVALPAHGTLAQSGATVTYTPALDYHGPDVFTFRARDPGGLPSAPATVSITVTPVNDAPVASARTATLPEDAGPTAILVSATDVDGDPLTYFVVSPPGHGTLSVSGATFTYTPAANYEGPDAFSFRASDGVLDSAPATVSVTVTPVNDPPVATADVVITAEDGVAAITLAGTDVDGDALAFTIAALPAHGVLSQAGAKVFYTPDPNYAGTDVFTFRASDGLLTSAPAAVSITVTPLNDAPFAVGRSVTVAEDSGANAIVVSGTDADGDPLSYLLVTPPAHGAIALAGSTFTYTPALNFNGPDSFTFKVNDGIVDSPVPATVTINVTPVNDAPVATPQATSTPEDSSISLTLSGSDVDGDPLTYAVVTPPAHGTLSGTAPNLTYTPAQDYAGPDAFTFQVNDGTASSAPATVAITVTPVNDAPVALQASLVTTEDAPGSVTLSGSDVDGDALTFVLGVQPAHGVVTHAGPLFTYTPAANYSGTDSFTFLVNDGRLTSQLATVSVTVTPVNDPPAAVPQALTTPEDTTGAVTLAGTDVDGDALTFAITQPAHGRVTLAGATATYTPDPNYFGPDAFTFVANDGHADSAPATVAVTVTPVNDAPQATARAIATAEDTAVTITLAGTDLEGSALTYALVTLPLHGTLTGAGASLVYTPAADFAGTDGFTFKVNDGSLDSAPASVAITVTPVQDPPRATPQAATVAEDSILSLTLAGTDPDGDALSFRVVSQPAHGTLGGAAPSLTYTPDPNYNGTDEFTFVANDGVADSAPATVAVSVLSVNDAPVATAKSATVRQGASVAIVLEGTDADGQPLSYAVASPPSHGTISGAAPDLTYTPDAGFSGADSFTYRVSDGIVSSATATVSITVTGEGSGGTVVGTESVMGCATAPGRTGGGAALLLAGLGLWLSRPRRRRGAAALALLLALPAVPRAAQDVPLPPPPAGTTAKPAAPAPRAAERPAAAPKGQRVALMPIKAGLGVEPKIAELVTDALVAELADRGLKTITSKDIEAALGFEKQKQMLGCSSDTSCLAEIAGALGADRVVFGDISMVRELTIFSVQVLNPKTGAVEHRFHERMAGGDAQDLLDATERAGGELFPGTRRSGTASRRKSVLSGTERPLSLVMRGGYDVQGPGGLGVLLVEYRLSRTVRVGAGPAVAGAGNAYGGVLRAAWHPLNFDRVSLFVAVEGTLLFPKETVFGVAPGLGVELALSRRFTLAAEAPYLLLLSAPEQYRTDYFVPSLAMAYRF